MNVKECLEEGLIKRDPFSVKKVPESLAISERFLKEAEGNFKMGYYTACELLSYNSSFHSARSLLFSKGYKERSHSCLISILKSLYKEDSEIKDALNIFDQLRLSRHEVQYGGALVGKEKAKTVLNFALKFHELTKKKLTKN